MAKKREKLINVIYNELKAGNFIVTKNKFSDDSSRWIDIDLKIEDEDSCYDDVTITISFDEKGTKLSGTTIAVNSDIVNG